MRRLLPLLVLALAIVAGGCDYSIVESEPGNPIGPGGAGGGGNGNGNGNGSGVPVVVSVTPASVTLVAGAEQQFAATVSDSTNTAVSWSVVAGGVGSISPTGLYRAPATLASVPVVVTVQAISVADAAAIGRATITLTAPAGPNRICFDREILPLFRSNCAMSGCHDSQTREEGYDFATAASIRRGVVPGNSHEGDIMEAIVGKREDDGRIDMENIMPPPPREPLTAAQIDLIRRWIEAGADTTSCPPPATGACDTSDVRWSTTVRPMLAANCVGCHNATYAGANVDLSNHAGASEAARNGKLYGTIAHAPGFTPMPYGGGKLDACTIEKIRIWIARGAPEN